MRWMQPGARKCRPSHCAAGNVDGIANGNAYGDTDVDSNVSANSMRVKRRAARRVLAALRDCIFYINECNWLRHWQQHLEVLMSRTN